MSTLPDPSNLDFFDGYLFRVMVDILKADGVDTSGLYNYYRVRIQNNGQALSGYDRMLVQYARTHFDPQQRKIVHAGTGIGTLPSGLAAVGFATAGIEQDSQRFRAANRLRDAIADAWPAAAERYLLILGEFPKSLALTPWISPESVLMFTNCVASWSDELTTHIIGSFRGFGDVILDTRVFGIVRDTPEERLALLDRIEAQGLKSKAIEKNPVGSFYVHLQRNDAP